MYNLENMNGVCYLLSIHFVKINKKKRLYNYIRCVMDMRFQILDMHIFTYFIVLTATY